MKIANVKYQKMRITIGACVGFFVFQIPHLALAEAQYVQPSGPVEGFSQDRLKELRAEVIPLEFRATSSDFGGVIACSKALCNRLGVPVPEGMEIDSKEEVGVEVHLQNLPKWLIDKSITNPPSFYTCQYVLLFPSKWDVYTADGADDWIGVSPISRSSLVRSLRFDDKIFMKKNIEKTNYIHSYRSSISENNNTSTVSLDAVEVHREVAPGLGMAIVKDDQCRGIKKGDILVFYIPKKSAYPHGSDKSRPKLTENLFNTITVPAEFVQEMQKFIFNK